ncbi:MAG: citrate synthase family protein [Alphaproteobacteria bacterium]|nr:citrate synthase family protein [Alphaproteobacteria bacterium]
MSAREAAARLGVKLETLYAYVSRGRLSSIEVPGSRERHYRAADIDALRSVRDGSRAPRPDAAEALIPVISSSICLIEGGRLYYRGRDALRLAESATLEEIAALLWRPDLDAQASTGAAAAGMPRQQEPFASGRSQEPPLAATRTAAGVRAGRSPTARRTKVESRVRGNDRTQAARPAEMAGLGMIERCQLRLAALAGVDLPALDLTRAGVARTGYKILRELAGCVAETAPSSAPVHAQFADRWGLDEAGADLLRRCLVLLADHELNASTFVARCVASTGATPYGVVSAALSALSGRRHGGASARAEALLHELAQSSDPMPVMAARLARDEELPGMGQPLYPEGDPRGLAILAAVGVALPQARSRIEGAVAAARQLTGKHPNVDFALAAAATALGLPAGAALGLFVVGRSVGWIAHAIEQYESGVLIRPRARYTGPRPAADAADPIA